MPTGPASATAAGACASTRAPPGAGCTSPACASCPTRRSTCSSTRPARAGASSRTAGCWTPTGVRDRVVEVEHDLAFDGTLMTGGVVRAALASGDDARDHRHRRGAAVDLHPRLHDRSRPRRARRTGSTCRIPPCESQIAGVYEQGCRFEADGVVGHGFLETGLGCHTRYLPDPCRPPGSRAQTTPADQRPRRPRSCGPRGRHSTAQTL